MEEIEEVVGDKTTVEADDLDKLTYLNQVQKKEYCVISVQIPHNYIPLPWFITYKYRLLIFMPTRCV